MDLGDDEVSLTAAWTGPATAIDTAYETANETAEVADVPGDLAGLQTSTGDAASLGSNLTKFSDYGNLTGPATGTHDAFRFSSPYTGPPSGTDNGTASGSDSEYAYEEEESQSTRIWHLVGALAAMFVIALCVFAVMRRIIRNSPAAEDEDEILDETKDETVDVGSRYERFSGDCEKQRPRFNKQFNIT